jgi:hypothetical protein
MSIMARLGDPVHGIHEVMGSIPISAGLDGVVPFAELNGFFGADGKRQPLTSP